ncbi:4-hydroxy-tetrahydrodipicolinate synthase [Aerococcus urinae]|uniref:4-hydroxy-tetrahydrodipicolinate synthase n=1 Tax=Aerococcus mictus TaxID=2976810 RepID=A0ABZ2EED5_9LACT|nr:MULTISPECIES: 4-hydroxy-tetrahydrodipicolinate synthase [Aerococcus]KAA9292838.1 4-hydroxy-tetrahydrodipicolinate synthase [Aerococcus mictus]MBU5610660.1 4-hydroxy-tetrahydrodipicolinate synthase [Aerococcus urinae]MCY3033763.1 4-hydroxy-tetrahydrodipicolinate synthase [Aerococcus mictus]MCY3063052.1 4-hydroxy-tetrahydrodipicolinate synthase [Aerococcus mictus]MCY3066713.1 4-hydroxy-tetrahydrodipicolinate synthase [Aerococcus mictus]
MSIYTGSGVALVTPYEDTAEKKVNFDVFKELIDFQIDAGTDALIIDGTTGEASTQTDEEQVEVIKFAVDYVNGRVPVIAGAGSNDTRHGVQLTKDCEAVGADAILSVTPYYLKTSQQGLIEHYHAIAGAVDIPVILYDVPGRTGMTIQPESLKELAKVDNIVALKDATGNFNHSVDNLHAVGQSIDFYSGNDDTIVPLMSLGAKGVISVLANIAPKAVNQMTHAALKSDFKTARKIQADYKPLIDLLFAEPNPIPIKAAVALLGFNVGPTRLPLTAPDSELVEKIKAEMHSLGII